MTQLEYCIQHSGCASRSVEATLQLFNEGASVPFIARYRKERTGALDEVQIIAIRDAAKKYDELVQRQQTILKSIEEQGKLDSALHERITTCFDALTLEDLYLPYKQKRLTRGEKARKLGLEPLAKQIMAQRGGDPEFFAERYLKNGIQDPEEALQGAADIIAEFMAENAIIRQRMRQLFERKAQLQSKVMKGKREEAEKYADYFDFSEPLYKVPSHRFLALFRGEREGYLSIKALPEKEEALQLMERFFVKSNDSCGDFVKTCCKDAYTRLIAPSIENEVIAAAKEKADLGAIVIFSKNLRHLLLAPPLGNKRILAIDPGFRTGCKVVCLDEHGALLHNETIYPHAPQNEFEKAKAKLSQLVESYHIQAIAIGDGTAGRETEQLVRKSHFRSEIEVFVVREDGASIYSASSVARKEFPQHDVTVRGAVSIGRRLMDPLAELVKIDPKSIGVGQYQHEVNQTLLGRALDDVVVSAVNNVGVVLNTASPYLLAYVSGLGPSLAENIVNYREKNGAFTSRKDLLQVPRLGEKAFELAAGFLRIPNGKHPLDNTAVHPESYDAVERMAKTLGVPLSELPSNNVLLSTLTWKEEWGIDQLTFEDIINELKKPGRDPRQQAAVLEFDNTIRTIADLRIGMQLPGIVSNVTAFGAFINIGIKENGLIHKSNLSDSYVSDASNVIALHEHVKVEVIEIDEARKRIGLRRLK